MVHCSLIIKLSTHFYLHIKKVKTVYFIQHFKFSFQYLTTPNLFCHQILFCLEKQNLNEDK